MMQPPPFMSSLSLRTKLYPSRFSSASVMSLCAHVSVMHIISGFSSTAIHCSSSNLFITLLAFTDTNLSLCTVMWPVLIFSSFLSPSSILCTFLVSLYKSVLVPTFFPGFVDWLPFIVVVILGWQILWRGGVWLPLLRAADVDLLLLGDSLPGVSFCVIRHHFPCFAPSECIASFCHPPLQFVLDERTDFFAISSPVP